MECKDSTSRGEKQIYFTLTQQELPLLLGQIYKIMLENYHLFYRFLSEKCRISSTFDFRKQHYHFLMASQHEQPACDTRKPAYRLELMNDKKEKRPRLARYIAIGMLLGLSLGAVMKNIPAGMGIGLALGMMFYQLSSKPDQGKEDEPGENQ